jgi:4-carboxymuconolactone decarboxylase
LPSADAGHHDLETEDPMTQSDVFERGLARRRAMFGPNGTKPVENADDFTRDFEEVVVTQHCFGEIWEREGLTQRERSLLTCAMLVALNRGPQLRGHVAGAIANGVTKEEFRELLLQASLYAGIPAAVEGFRIASEVFAEAGR